MSPDKLVTMANQIGTFSPAKARIRLWRAFMITLSNFGTQECGRPFLPMCERAARGLGRRSKPQSTRSHAILGATTKEPAPV